MAVPKKVILDYIGEPNIVFEFGFYDGADTIVYRKYFKNAKIYAFEADTQAYIMAKSELEKNNINFYHYAISNKIGQIDFYPTRYTEDGRWPTRGKGDPTPGGSTLKTQDWAQEDWSKFQIVYEVPIKVPAITIEEFCKQHGVAYIDFMHMDVEGAVREVLEGFGAVRPKLIWTETFPQGSPYESSNSQAEYDEMFKKIGYKKAEALDVDTLYVLKEYAKHQ